MDPMDSPVAIRTTSLGSSGRESPLLVSPETAVPTPFPEPVSLATTPPRPEQENHPIVPRTPQNTPAPSDAGSTTALRRPKPLRPNSKTDNARAATASTSCSQTPTPPQRFRTASQQLQLPQLPQLPPPPQLPMQQDIPSYGSESTLQELHAQYEYLARRLSRQGVRIKELLEQLARVEAARVGAIAVAVAASSSPARRASTASSHVGETDDGGGSKACARSARRLRKEACGVSNRIEACEQWERLTLFSLSELYAEIQRRERRAAHELLQTYVQTQALPQMQQQQDSPILGWPTNSFSSWLSMSSFSSTSTSIPSSAVSIQPPSTPYPFSPDGWTRGGGGGGRRRGSRQWQREPSWSPSSATTTAPAILASQTPSPLMTRSSGSLPTGPRPTSPFCLSPLSPEFVPGVRCTDPFAWSRKRDQKAARAAGGRNSSSGAGGLEQLLEAEAEGEGEAEAGDHEESTASAATTSDGRSNELEPSLFQYEYVDPGEDEDDACYSSAGEDEKEPQSSSGSSSRVGSRRGAMVGRERTASLESGLDSWRDAPQPRLRDSRMSLPSLRSIWPEHC